MEVKSFSMLKETGKAAPENEDTHTHHQNGQKYKHYHLPNAKPR